MSSCPGHPGLLPSCTELRIDKEEPKCAKSKAWKMVQQQIPQCFYGQAVHKSKDSKAVQSTVPKCNAPGIFWDPLGCRAEIEDS